MPGKMLRLVPWAMLVLTIGALAQAPTSKWSAWRPAMTPEGSAHNAIQYRWRSSPPCTLLGCQLAVQIRNTSHAPVRLHCSVYVDPPPLPYEDEIRPVTVDVLLKPFGGSRSGTRRAGDMTSPLTLTGVSISGVVVEAPKSQ